MSTGSKWLAGCGIGCGVLIIILVTVGAVGYFLIKDTVGDFRETEATHKKLLSRYGEVREFMPDPQAAIPGDRLEIFLTVREAQSEKRDEIRQALEGMHGNIRDLEQEGEGFWNVVGMIRKGAGVLPRIARYFAERNESLLQSDMGLGEYYYLYVTLYYSYLGKSPADGPPFRISGDDRNKGVNWNWDEEDMKGDPEDREDGEVYADRRDRISRHVNRYMRVILKNELDKAETECPECSAAWIRALKRELDLLRDDRMRIPWKDGMPAALETSLDPFRERIEATYDSMINGIEMESWNFD